MPAVEEKIKGFLRERGISLMGTAGPERWKNGPPSIDPTYMLPGAKSIIAWAVPFNVPAIYDFLSKKSPELQNVIYRQKAKKAAAKAGLKGKEARDPAVYDLKWVLASMFDQDKKKKRRDATRDTADFTA